jgi:hypothetical protein
MRNMMSNAGYIALVAAAAAEHNWARRERALAEQKAKAASPWRDLGAAKP